jgi:hypothetical protein
MSDERPLGQLDAEAEAEHHRERAEAELQAAAASSCMARSAHQELAEIHMEEAAKLEATGDGQSD